MPVLVTLWLLTVAGLVAYCLRQSQPGLFAAVTLGSGLLLAAGLLGFVVLQGGGGGDPGVYAAVVFAIVGAIPAGGLLAAAVLTLIVAEEEDRAGATVGLLGGLLLGLPVVAAQLQFDAWGTGPPRPVLQALVPAGVAVLCLTGALGIVVGVTARLGECSPRALRIALAVLSIVSPISALGLVAHAYLAARAEAADIAAHREASRTGRVLPLLRHERDPLKRAEIVRQLGVQAFMSQPAAVLALAEALGDRDARVRREAAWQLAQVQWQPGQSVDPSVSRALLGAARDRDPAVRAAVVSALLRAVQYGGVSREDLARVGVVLDRARRDRDPAVRQAADYAYQQWYHSGGSAVGGR